MRTREEIETLRNSINMIDFVMETELHYRHHSDHLKMNCLFHNEKTPSMAIYPAHYFCYSCGVHGDIFELVQKIYDITFADSIKILEEYEKEKKEMSTPVGD